jgi:hypothetical protein
MTDNRVTERAWNSAGRLHVKEQLRRTTLAVRNLCISHKAQVEFVGALKARINSMASEVEDLCRDIEVLKCNAILRNKRIDRLMNQMEQGDQKIARFSAGRRSEVLSLFNKLSGCCVLQCIETPAKISVLHSFIVQYNAEIKAQQQNVRLTQMLTA